MAHASMIGCDVGHRKEVGGILMYVYIYIVMGVRMGLSLI